MANASLVIKRPSWKEDDMALLCGIANAGGGSLLIETSQRDYKTGMRKMRKAFESIPSMTAHALGISCVTEPVMDGAQLCLSINIPKPDSAVSYLGKYYLFTNDVNQVIDKETAERTLKDYSGSLWEKQLQPHMKRSDIDEDILHNAANLPGLFDPDSPDPEKMMVELLETHGLVDTVTNSMTNIGVLLLHKEPHLLIPGAVIRIGEFDSSGFSTGNNALITGPITKQLKMAIEILRDKYHIVGHIDADNTRAYVPESAIKEALLNALVHKDYSSGTAININIYPERIFIENVGRPPMEWTVDTLLERHSSRPNNPSLSISLHLNGLFKGWGNGIDFIRTTCKRAGSCTPVFILNSDETIVQFELGTYVDPDEAPKQLDEASFQVVDYAVTSISDPASASGSGSSSQGSADQNAALRRPYSSSANSRFTERSFAAANGLDLTSTDEYVLKVLDKNGRATAARIADVLGVSETTVRRSFRKLREREIIERIGSDKAGYWKVML